MKPKQTRRASTYALKGGGFLHIDRLIIPIEIPKRRKCKRPNDEIRRPGPDAPELNPRRQPGSPASNG